MRSNPETIFAFRNRFIVNKIIELPGFKQLQCFRFVFYIKQDINLDKVVLQEEEVEYVEYMTVEQIKALIQNGLVYTSHAMMFKRVLEYKENIK